MKLTLEEAQKMMESNEGNLDLCGAIVDELPDNLTVGGWLDLSGTPIKKLPDKLTVGGWLYLTGTKIKELPDNLTVRGNLDLAGTPIKELPDNLTVGGCLDLTGTKIKELPDNLTVGGSLYLRRTGVTDLPDSLKVGDEIDCNDGSVRQGNLTNGTVTDDYIYADDILTLIKKVVQKGNYTYYVGKIKGKNVIYDGKNYAHCSSFKEGVEDLIFKSLKDRGTQQFENLTLDSVMSAKDLIAMYRIITGACRQGTDAFVQSIKPLKDSYTIAEAIEITKGQYGSQRFEKFFTKK